MYGDLNMKLTHDRLKQIIAEEIEEGLFDKAVGAVTGAAKGAVSGFKQGGVKGAVAGAQQQGKLEGEKKSLEADFAKLTNLAKEMSKQSAKDPKMAEVSKQVNYFLYSMRNNLEKLGIKASNVPHVGLSEQQAQPQQPQSKMSTLDKAKDFASALGTHVSDTMKRTPIVAAADNLLRNVIKMRKSSLVGEDKEKLQVLFKIQGDLTNLLKQLASVGQYSAVINVKKQPKQQPVKENKKLTRDMLSSIIKEELEEMIGTDMPSENDEAYGKIYLAKKRIQQVLHEAEFDLRNLEDESAKRFVEKINSMLTQLETE